MVPDTSSAAAGSNATVGVTAAKWAALTLEATVATSAAAAVINSGAAETYDITGLPPGHFDDHRLSPRDQGLYPRTALFSSHSGAVQRFAREATKGRADRQRSAVPDSADHHDGDHRRDSHQRDEH